jgi:RNA polymerase sigma-70 factor (ECF subfamily)
LFSKVEQLMSSFWAGKWTGQEPTLGLSMLTDFSRVSVVLRTKPPYGQWSDEMLAARMAQGDVVALDTLYDRHSAMVLGIVLKITSDRPRAEQVLQETFWQAWQGASLYSSQHGSFASWLFRMARQLAIEAEHKVASTSNH